MESEKVYPPNLILALQDDSINGLIHYIDSTEKDDRKFFILNHKMFLYYQRIYIVDNSLNIKLRDFLEATLTKLEEAVTILNQSPSKDYRHLELTNFLATLIDVYSELGLLREFGLEERYNSLHLKSYTNNE